MSELNIDRARFNMIEQQVRTWDVLDQRVLNVMNDVPRERFVPEQYRNLAFADLELPIGHGEVMTSPKLEGRILQALHLSDDDRVLEVGTGTGYLTACLARLAAKVVTVEIVSDLSQEAQRRLAGLEIDNVTFRIGDAADGWTEDGAFDAIAITGSMPEVPDTYKHQLSVGGRMFVVVGDAPAMEAMLITRVDDDDWMNESLFETELPRLRNAERKQPFVF